MNAAIRRYRDSDQDAERGERPVDMLPERSAEWNVANPAYPVRP